MIDIIFSDEANLYSFEFYDEKKEKNWRTLKIDRRLANMRSVIWRAKQR